MSLLKYNHISNAVDDTLSYISDRKSGKIKSLKTSKVKLNQALLGGLEWYRIFTIAGLSGSGKSIVCEELKRDLVILNQNENFEVLSFEFEMLPRDQIARSLSGRLGISTKELYSAATPLADDAYAAVLQEIEYFRNFPIYHVDEVGSVDQIEDTIWDFIKSRSLIAQNKGLVVTLDHTLLTKGKTGESEKSTIDDLMKRLVYIKKTCKAKNQKILFIIISQLNRGIESPERTGNPLLHYPNKNDIFAASSVYYSSDYVMVTHKPASIDGISSLYGPPRPSYPEGLPVYNPENPKQAMVYWHLIKERFGQPKILMMLDDFKNSKVSEYGIDASVYGDKHVDA